MKFAHIADAHLGAFSKNPMLAEYNMQAFEKAMEICLAEQVDFIIIAGDLFHNPIPDMELVKRAVKIMKKVKETGIRIYVIYGSHDFSGGTTSLMDVLSTAGVFIKAVKYEMHNGKIVLKAVRDNTGVSIVGMSGLTSSIEVKYFTEGAIDIPTIEKIPDPKIFVFHTTVLEVKPVYIHERNAVPVNTFPKSFNYYAGGHLHEKIEYSYSEAPLIYPGALFGATYNDLDIMNSRGFYIVKDFNPEFVPVHVCDFEKRIFRADGKSAREMETQLMEFAKQDHGGKVVILKITGELDSGRIADINFRAIRNKIKNTASEVLLNTYSLRTAEQKNIKIPATSGEDIEQKVFEEISVYGTDFTNTLYRILKNERPADEKKSEFESRIWKDALTLFEPILKRKNEKYKSNLISEQKSGGNDREKGKKYSTPEHLNEEKINEKPEKTQKNKSLFDFG